MYTVVYDAWNWFKYAFGVDFCFETKVIYWQHKGYPFEYHENSFNNWCVVYTTGNFKDENWQFCTTIFQWCYLWTAVWNRTWLLNQLEPAVFCTCHKCIFEEKSTVCVCVVDTMTLYMYVFWLSKSWNYFTATVYSLHDHNFNQFFWLNWWQSGTLVHIVYLIYLCARDSVQ